MGKSLEDDQLEESRKIIKTYFMKIDYIDLVELTER
jgi:hypothetical protein